MRFLVLLMAGWGEVTLLGGPVPACGRVIGQAGVQAIAGAERRALLESARGRYYSLTAHGVRSFTCRVHFDFGTVSKTLLPPEDQADRRLLESAEFALKVGPGGPALTYQFPQGSVSQSQETVAAVTLWVSELVQGFFQTWPPRGFDGPVPEDRQVKQLVKEGEGYRVSAKVAGGAVEMRLDKDSLVTEVVGRGGAETERPRFQSTTDGLVYAGGDAVEMDTDGRTETRYAIETGRAGDLMLPRTVRLRVGEHVDVRWEMTGCSVERK